MSFQNEEDYLDNLLKSITENKDNMSQDELFTVDSNMKIPDDFSVEEAEESSDSDVYKEMLFSEDDGLKVEHDILPPIAETVQAEEEFVEEKSEDELIDEYIKNVLDNEDLSESEPEENSEYRFDDADLQDLINTYSADIISDEEETVNEVENVNEESSFEPEIPETTYIDITDQEDGENNDLLSRLDNIFADVEEELIREQQEMENTVEEEVEEDPDLHIDEELKMLLGISDESELDEIQEDNDESLSEEELTRIESMNDEMSENDSAVEESVEEEPEDDNSDISQLMSLLAEEGLDSQADESSENDDVKAISDEIFALDIFADNVGEIPEIQEKPSADNEKAVEKSAKKVGFIEKILSIFKKKEKKELSDDDILNENQQLLDSMFDENGDLIDDNSVAVKKSLFDGSSSEDNLLLDIEELEKDSGSKKKKKEKKEKKKKEPKPKDKKKQDKPKKPKKVKPKKIKQPVDPSELIQIKFSGILVMLLIIAGFCSYVYFGINSFNYEQAYNDATYYMVNKKYTFAYDCVAGIEPKYDEDVALKNQIVTVMHVQKYYDSCERYEKMGRTFDAIDSLIRGLTAYEENLADATELGVVDDINNVRANIIAKLQQYGITEEMAKAYAAVADYEQYKYILETFGGVNSDSDY